MGEFFFWVAFNSFGAHPRNVFGYIELDSHIYILVDSLVHWSG
jgi:hypothetical protein